MCVSKQISKYPSFLSFFFKGQIIGQIQCKAACNIFPLYKTVFSYSQVLNLFLPCCAYYFLVSFSREYLTIIQPSEDSQPPPSKKILSPIAPSFILC